MEAWFRFFHWGFGQGLVLFFVRQARNSGDNKVFKLFFTFACANFGVLERELVGNVNLFNVLVEFFRLGGVICD